MFCKTCGTDIPDGSSFCPKCGKPVVSAESVNVDATAENPNETRTILSKLDEGKDKMKKAANVDKPIYKKWWFWVIVVVVICVIRGAVSGNNSPEDATRSERDGFANTNTIQFYDISMQIPTYFGDESDNSTDQRKYYYAEKGDGTAFVMLLQQDLDADQAEFESQHQTYLDSFGESIDDFSVEETRTISLGGRTAYLETFTGVLSDKQLEGTIVVTFVEETQHVYSISLCQTEGTEYSYKNDFEKLLNSVQVTETTSTETTTASTTESSEVTASFKETMDSYEDFFDDYVEFMKKYEDSDGTDYQMLSDYTEFMTQYADYMDKLNSIDTDSLSNADLAYYTEVNARILNKLAEIS